jgi:hypothetical protein
MRGVFSMSGFFRLIQLVALTTVLSAAVSADARETGAQDTPAQQTTPETHTEKIKVRQHGLPPTAPTTFTVTAESGVPEIPFKLINNHLILPIRINGSTTVDTVLDTGMPTPGLALYEGPRTQDLELEFDPNIKAQVGGAGGKGALLTARIAHDASLELEGLSIEGVRIIALPELANFGGYHDAIIGYSLFERFVVELDYDRGLVRLHEPAAYEAPADAHILPMTLRQRRPYVTVRVTPYGGETFDAEVVVDVGASHAISLNTGSSELITVPEKSLRTVLGRGLSGSVEGEVGRLATLELAGARLGDVMASFPVAEHQHPGRMDSRAGNLGSDVLRRFKTIFDYSREQMLLVPNESFAEPFEWDRSGLRVGVGRALEVESVIPGSPAEESGILVGDILTHIDGKAVTAADYGEIKEALIGTGEVRLTIERGEESLEKKVVLRRMI